MQLAVTVGPNAGKTKKTEQVDCQRSSSTEEYYVHKDTSLVGGNTKLRNKSENQQNNNSSRRLVNRSYPKGYDVRLNTGNTIRTYKQRLHV